MSLAGRCVVVVVVVVLGSAGGVEATGAGVGGGVDAATGAVVGDTPAPIGPGAEVVVRKPVVLTSPPGLAGEAVPPAGCTSPPVEAADPLLSAGVGPPLLAGTAAGVLSVASPLVVEVVKAGVAVYLGCRFWQHSQPARAIPAQTRPIRPTTGFLPIGFPFPVK
jgi:hypothetical protein